MKITWFTMGVVLLSVGLIGTAGADILWNGATGDTLWRTSGNWNTGAVPAPGVGAIFINNQDNGTLVLVDASTNTSLDSDIFGPEWGMTLEVDGGTLATTGFSFAPIGDVADPSVVNVKNNGSLTVHNLLIGDNWWFGTAPGVILNVYDTSTVTATDWCWLGGKMNLYGGTVDITGGFNMNASLQNNAHLDIEAGTLIIRGGDYSVQIEEWIAAGQLTAYGTAPNLQGSGSIIVDTTTIAGGTIITALPSLSAREPEPMPLNDDGSVGILVSNTEAEVTLNWLAGIDPNTASGNVMNPEIVAHYIWFSPSAEDPNLILLDTVPHTNPGDPAASYGPMILDENAIYYWSIEEALDNGTGNAYLPGDPNNILGPIWSFTTIAATPEIQSGPVNTVADPDAEFTVTASSTADHFQWYKIGDPDIALEDAGPYSGTKTETLVVTNATLAEEGLYYCIAFNGETPSEPSPSARLWTRRLMGHWKFDGDMTDSVQDAVAGAPVHDGSIADNGGPGDPNYAAGIDGSAMEFFNDGDFVAIPDADFFNFHPLGFTASYWYKQNTYVGWRLPMSKLDTGTAGWLTGVDSDVRNQAVCIIESANDAANWADGNDAINVGDGQWHMITVIYDPAETTLTMFTDGDENESVVLDLSDPAIHPLPEALLSIGGFGADVINGLIDDVQVYSYALTPLEVAQLYVAFETEKWICVEDPDNPLNIYDINGDCRIDLSDFAEMAAKWLECQRYPEVFCN